MAIGATSTQVISGNATHVGSSRWHIGAVPSRSTVVQRCLKYVDSQHTTMAPGHMGPHVPGLMAIMVFALSATPPLLFLRALWNLSYPHEEARILVVAIAMLPAYVLFACMLVLLSALSTRLVGWRTPADVTLSISSLDPQLLTWVQAMVMLHLVRVLAGSMFRASPIWSLYLRLNGARLGRRVFVNSLAVVDHNLLEFGDDVIIGDGAHVAGHTVEDGLLKTARVRFGRGVTIGVGSVVGIGVDAGSDCRVGALSVVPKFTRLDSGATYVGAPVRKLGVDKTARLTRDADARQQTSARRHT
jgi:acetyltransferase-like isoleucine patch superfamily enzyme